VHKWVRNFPFPKLSAFRAFEKLSKKTGLFTRHHARQFCLVAALRAGWTIFDRTIGHFPLTLDQAQASPNLQSPNDAEDLGGDGTNDASNRNRPVCPLLYTTQIKPLQFSS
jgi:hypothetical protein